MKNNKRRKVLIVAGNMNMGGVEKQVIQIVKNLKDECEFSFFLSEKGGYYEKELIQLGCKLHYVRDTWDNIINIIKVIRRERYDIVHAHQLHHNALIILAAWFARVPKRISHSHSSRNSNTRNKILLSIYFFFSKMILLLFATDLVACANNAGDFLYGSQIGKNKRYRVVHNAVAIERFLYPKSEVAISKEDGFKYIMHVGRFSRVKNHVFIIRLAQRIKELDLKYRFLLVGDGDTREMVEKSVKQAGVEKWIQFLGQRDDIPELMKAADVFILPSFYEGLPITLIEAQAAGKNCIVSDTITREVDFGLGLICYKSLEEPVDHWIETIEYISRKDNKLTKLRIEEAAAIRGFTDKAFIESIKEVYLK